MFYVYILRLKNGQFYTGFTGNLKKRLKEHQSGKVASTSLRRPAKLIYYEAYLLKSDAQRRERFLKRSEGKELLRKQLRDYINFSLRRGGRVA